MRQDQSMKLKLNKMIVGLNKIKDMEFNFPIKNAKNAMYKVLSINELDKVNSSTGNWGAVILAQADKKQGYMIPEHVVFTIEYDTQVIPTFHITAITSDNDSAKIDVSKNALSTPDKFFECLKEIAETTNFKI